MLVSRIAIATAALVIGSTYALFAQQAPKPQPIGMLLAAGDISTCGKDEEWKKYAGKTAGLIREAIQQADATTPPLPYRVIALGDLAYGTGTSDQFKCFGERWTFKNEAILPVPGNHEYLNRDKDNNKTDAGPYFENFKDHPLVTQNGTKKGYYALKFPETKPETTGAWRLIGLNDNFESDAKYQQELAAQTEWLKKDLADATNQQNCVLAFWHAPTFSSGRHGHGYKKEKNAPLSKERHMQKTFSLLHQHGASVVLAGHEHSYEQFHKQDADGKAADDGIRLFVVGTGGSLLTEDVYTHKEDNSEGGAFGKTRGIQGVLKILLYENRYEWNFLPIDPTKKLTLATTSGDCNKRK
jgi:hypothetical protein